MSKGKYAVYERTNRVAPEDNPTGELAYRAGFHVFFFPEVLTASICDQDLGWYYTLEAAKNAISVHKRRNIPVYEEEA